MLSDGVLLVIARHVPSAAPAQQRDGLADADDVAVLRVDVEQRRARPPAARSATALCGTTTR